MLDTLDMFADEAPDQSEGATAPAAVEVPRGMRLVDCRMTTIYRRVTKRGGASSVRKVCSRQVNTCPGIADSTNEEAAL